LAGRIYRDYVAGIKKGICDEIAYFNEKNILNNGLKITQASIFLPEYHRVQ
jgi:hypothetical protein